MDCKSYGSLKDVPADKVGEYVATCLQPSAAGPSLQSNDLGLYNNLGIVFFLILCVLAIWQLLWAKRSAKAFWSGALGLGILGLGFLLGF